MVHKERDHKLLNICFLKVLSPNIFRNFEKSYWKVVTEDHLAVLLDVIRNLLSNVLNAEASDCQAEAVKCLHEILLKNVESHAVFSSLLEGDECHLDRKADSFDLSSLIHSRNPKFRVLT